jgi:hypothetical protein
MEGNTEKEYLPELHFLSSNFQKSCRAFRLMNRATDLCGHYSLYDEMEFFNVTFRQMAKTTGRVIGLSFVLKFSA